MCFSGAGTEWTGLGRELRRMNTGEGGQDPCPEGRRVQPHICLMEGGCEPVGQEWRWS